MCKQECIKLCVVSLSHGTEHGIVATNLWTILFVFSLCVANLIKFGLQEKGRMLNEIKQAIKLFNIPLKPTYYHQTRQHNVACDEKLLEHQLVLATSKTRLNQLTHCSLNYHCSEIIP